MSKYSNKNSKLGASRLLLLSMLDLYKWSKIYQCDTDVTFFGKINICMSKVLANIFGVNTLMCFILWKIYILNV